MAFFLQESFDFSREKLLEQHREFITARFTNQLMIAQILNAALYFRVKDTPKRVRAEETVLPNISSPTKKPRGGAPNAEAPRDAEAPKAPMQPPKPTKPVAKPGKTEECRAAFTKMLEDNDVGWRAFCPNFLVYGNGAPINTDDEFKIALGNTECMLLIHALLEQDTLNRCGVPPLPKYPIFVCCADEYTETSGVSAEAVMRCIEVKPHRLLPISAQCKTPQEARDAVYSIFSRAQDAFKEEAWKRFFAFIESWQPFLDRHAPTYSTAHIRKLHRAMMDAMDSGVKWDDYKLEATPVQGLAFTVPFAPHNGELTTAVSPIYYLFMCIFACERSPNDDAKWRKIVKRVRDYYRPISSVANDDCRSLLVHALQNSPGDPRRLAFSLRGTVLCPDNAERSLIDALLHAAGPLNPPYPSVRDERRRRVKVVAEALAETPDELETWRGQHPSFGALF